MASLALTADAALGEVTSPDIVLVPGGPGTEDFIDGKYATAAGVSAGIDLALDLTGRVAGDRIAEAIQLVVEYDPQPPYATGSTATAPADLVEALRASDLVVESSVSR